MKWPWSGSQPAPAPTLHGGAYYDADLALQTVRQASRRVTRRAREDRLPVVGPLIGRAAELTDAEARLTARSALVVSGPDAIGKSTLIGHLSSRCAGLGQDGVAVLDVLDRTADEVTQAIFAEFFVRPGAPVKVELSELRRHAGDLDAVIFIDHQRLSGNELLGLRQALPEARLVFTAEQGYGPEVGASLPLGGLSQDDGLELFRHDLQVDRRTEPALRRLVTALDGHPGRIRLAAIALRDRTSQALADGAEAFVVSPGDVAGEAWAKIGPAGQRVLTFLALLDGAAASPQNIAHVLGVKDLADVLTRLEEDGLVRRNSPRYRLVAPEDAVRADPGERRELLDAALRTYHRWAMTHRGAPETIALELDAALAVLRQAGAQEQDPRLRVELAWALEPTMALSGRWDGWLTVLETLEDLVSPREAPAVLAYALHQRGMRARAVGDRPAARAAFARAVKVARLERTHHAIVRSTRELALSTLPPAFENAVLAVESALERPAVRWVTRTALPVSAAIATLGAVGYALGEGIDRLVDRLLESPGSRRLLAAFALLVGLAIVVRRRRPTAPDLERPAYSLRAERETSAAAEG